MVSRSWQHRCLFALGLSVWAMGAFMIALMISAPAKPEVGASHSQVLRALGPPDQVWNSTDSPTIKLWFSDRSGEVVRNDAAAFVYFGRLDTVTLVLLDEEKRVVEVFSGGT